MLVGVVAHAQVRPPSSVRMTPPVPFAPPAPSVLPNQPRFGLAKSGPIRWPPPQATAFGLPRVVQLAPPLLVDWSSYFAQLLDVQVPPSRLRTQAFDPLAASIAAMPVPVERTWTQFVPPSDVAYTSVASPIAATDNHPREALAIRRWPSR